MTDEEVKKAIWQTVEKGMKAFIYTTVDGEGYPRGRYMGAVMVKDGLIYMATYADSRKVRQIKENPRSEVVFALNEFKRIATISGQSGINDSLELKEEFWKLHPQCKDYFSSYDAAEFALIEFRPCSAEYLDLDLQHTPLAVSLP